MGRSLIFVPVAVLGACLRSSTGVGTDRSPGPSDSDRVSDSEAAESDGGPCGSGWSQDCVVEDGFCRDPAASLDLPLLTNATIDDFVRAWVAMPCGPLYLALCEDTSFLVFAYGAGGEGPTVNVYDATSRVWVGGFDISDQGVSPCWGNVWMGSEATLGCAQAAREWVGEREDTCVPAADQTSTCDAEACVFDGLSRP